MGTIRKIGDEYYIEFSVRGLLYQQKAGKEKDAAEKMLKEVEGKIQKGEMEAVVRDVDLDVFLKTFLEYACKEHTPRTFTRYKAVVKHFDGFCATALSKNSKLSEVTPRVIEDYRASLIKSDGEALRAIKPRTINLTLHLVKDILDYAIQLGYLNDNPALHARLVEVDDQKVLSILNAQDTKNLLLHAPIDLRNIIEVILGAGLCVEELIRLKWTEVDFHDNCFKIEKPFGCAVGLQKIRHIPMDAMVAKVMEALHKESQSYQERVFVGSDGHQLKREQLTVDLARAVEKSGIHSTVTFYSLRNTFARNVLQKGISLVGLARLLGLSDVVKVMRYAAPVE